ncbi:DNA-binding transcriptional LysR family regulator [Geomicrobium halophilum]|uniref:DNA-binding transcriptional LysR family regulator n=1 Tax=Geomicrobium halophilum TaxID=549000 RepID=A0A841PZM9_9BACL|nr:LysR substrate-binding domain-containing protein [Geomicrobium halophilum]MBB6449975.1 DNA-binding transcriptional LysR family regulator [Geomicrobium halophilum]
MNIKLLELFCLIVEEGSISGAARRAYQSQPSVTKSIRYLEDEYGALLFHREKGQISLTEVGHTLYPHAKAILSEYKNSVEAVRYQNEKIQSQLKIGASFTIGEYLLPSVISKYKKQKDDQLQLFINNTPRILEMLEENVIDLAFVEGEVTGEAFNQRAIANDEIVLFVSPSDPWADRTHILTSDLKNHKLISREKDSGTRKIIQEHLANHRISPISPYLELSTTQAVKSAVQSGLGYGFASRFAVEQEIKNHLLVHVPVADLKISRPLWSVTKPLRFEKPAIETFLRMTKDMLGRDERS